MIIHRLPRKDCDIETIKRQMNIITHLGWNCLYINTRNSKALCGHLRDFSGIIVTIPWCRTWSLQSTPCHSQGMSWLSGWKKLNPVSLTRWLWFAMVSKTKLFAQNIFKKKHYFYKLKNDHEFFFSIFSIAFFEMNLIFSLSTQILKACDRRTSRLGWWWRWTLRKNH